MKSLKTILSIKKRNSLQSKQHIMLTFFSILITHLTFDTGFVIAAVFDLTLAFAIFPIESKIWQYLCSVFKASQGI